jgi:hypothetical protein
MIKITFYFHLGKLNLFLGVSTIYDPKKFS